MRAARRALSAARAAHGRLQRRSIDDAYARRAVPCSTCLCGWWTRASSRWRGGVAAHRAYAIALARALSWPHRVNVHRWHRASSTARRRPLDLSARSTALAACSCTASRLGTFATSCGRHRAHGWRHQLLSSLFTFSSPLPAAFAVPWPCRARKLLARCRLAFSCTYLAALRSRAFRRFFSYLFAGYKLLFSFPTYLRAVHIRSCRPYIL